MAHLVIESKNDELWKNNIANVVLEKTNYIDENYELLQDKIKENTEKCKIIVNDTLKNLSKELVKANSFKADSSCCFPRSIGKYIYGFPIFKLHDIR